MRSVSLSILVAVVISACATELAVNDRFVSNVDVAQLTNYAWTEPDDPVSDPLVRSAHELIRLEVNNRLTARGYVHVPKNQADFLVHHAIVEHFEITEKSGRDIKARKEQDLISGERSDPYFESREQSEGILYVFLSRPGGESFWEGRVDTPLDYRGPGARRIPEAIRDLFTDFPARDNDR